MRLRTSRIALTTAVVGAAALTLGLSSTAHADTGARSGDIVGVGSDTLQNGADFVLDAGGNGAGGGYDSAGNLNRIFDYYATGDANGRATFDGTCGTATAPAVPTICTTANAGAPNALAGTVILRGGQNPVPRPNGSGQGVGALINDASGGSGYDGLATGSIQFARMSRLPTDGIPAGATNEESLCTAASACGGLHVYQFATDNLGIAHLTTGFNGPATGLSVADLVNIYNGTYTKWNQIPGNASGSSDNIDPLIPQSGSGTRTFFLADLQTANGGNPITLAGDVRTVQEHDPDGIYQDPNKADAIEPFSTGKLSLINSGYFAQGGPAFAKNLLSVFPTGNTADGTSATVYSSTRGLYFTIRNSDLVATPVVPFQPGGTLNWAQTLFAGGTVGGVTVQPYIASTAAAAGIKDAGFTQAYKDCGVNPTSC